jgi:SOS response regulatory protein OraA/RecX
MFGKPRQLDTEAELYDVAVRALMRRAHSVHEMKKVLARRSDNELLVQVVMARLRENGQLDDSRFAKQFARDLRARGIMDHHVDAAIADAANPETESATIRTRLQRKLKLLASGKKGGELDDRKIASLYRSLLRAGFSSDAIRRELKSLTKEDVPELDRQDGSW